MQQTKSIVKNKITYLCAFTTLAVLAATASAQTAPNATKLSAQVYELMTYQCGVKEVADRFNIAIAALDEPARVLLTEILTTGLPDEIRRRANADAERRYTRRQAWLRNNGEELFGEDTKRIGAKTLTEYSADQERQLLTLFRENAVRGLGVIGVESDIVVIDRAAVETPHLGALVRASRSAIRQRR